MKYDIRIQKTETCWLWLGAKDKAGYGRIRMGGKGSKVRLAHVVIYEIYKGVVPVGLEIDHTCRNRDCVNPDHLEPVTHDENMERAYPHWFKTHCPQGHELTPKNTYTNPKGRRICRTCTNARSRTRNTDPQRKAYMRSYHQAHKVTI